MTVFSKNYTEPPFNLKEALRYAGVHTSDKDMERFITDTFHQIKDKLVYKVCYLETDVSVKGKTVDFGIFETVSKNLSYTLKDAKKAIIFCATIGLNIDREIAKNMKISPPKGVILQAIGTERCESLCDMFTDEIKSQYKNEGIFITPRFSPGYGDLNVSVQKDIFSHLDLQRKIGVTLNESLIISPSKSVTAIIGLSSKNCGYDQNKCKGCNMKECTFRQ